MPQLIYWSRSVPSGCPESMIQEGKVGEVRELSLSDFVSESVSVVPKMPCPNSCPCPPISGAHLEVTFWLKINNNRNHDIGHIICPWTISREWIWASDLQNMDQLLDHLKENRSLIITFCNIIKSIKLFISSVFLWMHSINVSLFNEICKHISINISYHILTIYDHKILTDV